MTRETIFISDSEYDDLESRVAAHVKHARSIFKRLKAIEIAEPSIDNKVEAEFIWKIVLPEGREKLKAEIPEHYEAIRRVYYGELGCSMKKAVVILMGQTSVRTKSRCYGGIDKIAGKTPILPASLPC